MTPRLIRTFQRMVMLITAMGLLAMLIAYQFEDARVGFVFLGGCVFGVVCDAVIHWFWFREGWFGP
jgi:hypothetical protein